MRFRGDRLLKVARALRESKRPKWFNMGQYGYDCGSPACALGHYASRRDLQRAFKLMGNNIKADGVREFVAYYEPAVYEHFGITAEESSELFCAHGCGEATTAKQAARYIENFVKRMERQLRKYA